MEIKERARCCFHRGHHHYQYQHTSRSACSCLERPRECAYILHRSTRCHVVNFSNAPSPDLCDDFFAFRLPSDRKGSTSRWRSCNLRNYMAAYLRTLSRFRLPDLWIHFRTFSAGSDWSTIYQATPPVTEAAAELDPTGII